MSGAAKVIDLDARRREPRPHGWHDLGWLNSSGDKRDALRICQRLGMHVILLWGVTDGVCSCGKPECTGKSRGKHPVAGGWTKAAFDFEQIDAALTKDQSRFNLGWRMGEQLDGSMLVCFDVDGPMTLIEPLEAQFGKLPATLTASSGRGFHLFFRLAKTSAVPGNVKLCGIQEIDIRCVGGQVVIAPSRHYSGTAYKWINCVEPAEIDL